MLIMLARLWNSLERARKWQFLLLCMLMLTGAVFEVATLGAVMPFLSIMADPGSATKFPFLEKLAKSLQLSGDDLLFVSAVVFASVAITASFVRLAVIWIATKLVFGVGHDLGVRVFRQTLCQPYEWHVCRNSSESLAAIYKVQIATSSGLMPLVKSGVAAVLALFIVVSLAFIDTKTTFIAAAGFGVCYGLIFFVLRKLVSANGIVISKSQGSRVRAVQEGIGGIRDVLLDRSQGIFLRRFEHQDAALRSAQASNSIVGQFPRYALEGIALVLISFLAWRLASSEAGMQGALPVLGALALGGQKLIPLLQQVYAGWTKLGSAKASIVDVLELVELPGTIAQQVPRISFDSCIEVNNLFYTYPGDNAPVIKGLSFSIDKGQRIGVIGKTGSGKSTLCDILMGLLPPTSGSIYIDETALNTKGARDSWSAKVAHVPQAIYLTDDTVRNNIAFGVEESDIDNERVAWAAEQADIHDFIDSLDNNFDTMVGERGVRFSGGQRQRLGIARALYKKCEVLVLDEATSALDDKTESSVIESIENLPSDITTIVIAHRISTLKHCDAVLQLEDGNLLGSFDYDDIAGLA